MNLSSLINLAGIIVFILKVADLRFPLKLSLHHHPIPIYVLTVRKLVIFRCDETFQLSVLYEGGGSGL